MSGTRQRGPRVDGMKDAGQKDRLYRHFRAQGWYAVLEVPVYHGGGAHGQRKPITDVDVLALRPGSDLRWELVLGDCKTKRSESPANRCLWLRSLMDHFGATRGLVLLRRDRVPIEPDHKLFAYSLGVGLLDDAEFVAYDQAVVYPAGSGGLVESAADLRLVRDAVPARYPRLLPLVSFLQGAAWNERDLVVLLRRVIAAGRTVHKEMDPTQPAHLALALEASSAFAVGLASCVGTIFQQYLQPNDKSTLGEALKALIWQGRERYDYIAGLRKQLLEARGGDTGDDGAALALPEWERFIHLVRSHLDVPALAFETPQLLREAAVSVATGREFLPASNGGSSIRAKLAMLSAAYYMQASLFPADFRTRVQEIFIHRMARMAAAQADSAKANRSPADRADKGREKDQVVSGAQQELPVLSPERSRQPRDE